MNQFPPAKRQLIETLASAAAVAIKNRRLLETFIATDRKLLTVDDMWAVQRVGTPRLSPDGKTVAYTVSVYDMDENRSV